MTFGPFSVLNYFFCLLFPRVIFCEAKNKQEKKATNIWHVLKGILEAEVKWSHNYRAEIH